MKTIILVCLLSFFSKGSSLNAQYQVDTLGALIGKVRVDGENFYQCVNNNNDTLLIEPERPLYVSDPTRIMQPRDYRKERFKKAFYLRNNKIVGGENLPICDQEIEHVFAKFRDNFVVRSNGSCYLLTAACEMKFLEKIKDDKSVLYSRNIGSHFLVKGKAKNSIRIVNWQGEELAAINSNEIFQMPRVNQFFIFSKGKAKEEKYKAAKYYKIYNLQGEFVTEGEVLGSNQETLYVLNHKGEKEFFHKEEKIAIPENINSIFYYNHSRINVEDKRGYFSFANNRLEPDFIERKFRSAEFLSSMFSARLHSQEMVNAYKNDLHILYDKDDRIHIYDYNGKEKASEYDFSAKKSGDIILSDVCSVELNKDILFTCVEDESGQLFLFDENWQFLKKIKAAERKSYKLSGPDNVNIVKCHIPPTALGLFNHEIASDEFFVVRRDHRKANIVDAAAELVLEKDVSSILRVNKNHFIVKNRSNSDPNLEKYVLKITKR